MSRVLERASSELSLAHYRVLSAIASGDERASRVAERLELGKPTVSASVEALCRAGYLDRAVESADQRALALRITDAGSAVLGRVEAEMVRRVDEMCARTPNGAQVRQALAWMGQAIDQMAAERRTGRRGPDR
jgi:DNA-binding MarR family transcriptional regulator